MDKIVCLFFVAISWLSAVDAGYDPDYRDSYRSRAVYGGFYGGGRGNYGYQPGYGGYQSGGYRSYGFSGPRYGGYSVGVGRGRHGSHIGSYDRYGRIARRRSRFGYGMYRYDSDNDFYDDDYGYGYDDDFYGYDDDYRGYGRRYGYRSQPGIYARRGHGLYDDYSGYGRYRGYGYDGMSLVIHSF